MTGPDLSRIRATLDLLQQIPVEDRMEQLKNLCVNNGIWTVPEDARAADYTPAYFEIVLFGLPALADEAEDLPTNWMRAARNVLKAAPARAAA